MAKRKRKPRETGYEPGQYCLNCGHKIRDVMVGIDNSTGNPVIAIIKHWYTPLYCTVDLQVEHVEEN